MSELGYQIKPLTFHFQDTLIEKLRLKNATLKVKKKKLHMQLKQVREIYSLIQL